ncbi:MAG: PIN domain-containing protein [Anaerolineales bacterium]
MRRIVLDTNIFISALLGGFLGVIVDKWKSGKFTLIITDAIAPEYLDLINHSKFKFSEDEIISTTRYRCCISVSMAANERNQTIFLALTTYRLISVK